MRLDESSPVERAAVEAAAKNWASRPNGNPNLRDPRHTEGEFRQITCDWLNFAGRLCPKPVTTPHQLEIDAYCLYLERERSRIGLHKERAGVPDQILQKYEEEIPQAVQRL
jgi:hypothetical protein